MEGNINSNQNKTFSKKETIEIIEATRNSWGSTGAVDSEWDTTNRLLEKLERGEISSEKALEEIQKIDDSRMDYH